MLKAAAKVVLTRLGVIAPPPPSSWERYRDYVRVHSAAIVDPTASIRIFNPSLPPSIALEIGEGSHIFSNFALMRPNARIRVGKRSQLGASTFIAADSIDVGDDVLMAWGVTIMDNDSHALSWEQRKNDVKQCYDDYQSDPSNLIRNKDWSHVAMAPISIGDRVWIGFGASILKGVKIGAEAVVAAGSMVVRDVPAGAVVAGNPARIVRP